MIAYLVFGLISSVIGLLSLAVTDIFGLIYWPDAYGSFWLDPPASHSEEYLRHHRHLRVPDWVVRVGALVMLSSGIGALATAIGLIKTHWLPVG